MSASSPARPWPWPPPGARRDDGFARGPVRRSHRGAPAHGGRPASGVRARARQRGLRHGCGSRRVRAGVRRRGGNRTCRRCWLRHCRLNCSCRPPASAPVTRWSCPRTALPLRPRLSQSSAPSQCSRMSIRPPVRSIRGPSREALTPRTAAVIAVHLYGHPAPMDELRAITEPAGVRLFEDSAQAFGATLGGKAAGSLGDGAAFSFYPGKNLGALGEAGAVTTDDAAIADGVAVLRAHGERSKHVHEVVGTNERLDELQAAFLAPSSPTSRTVSANGPAPSSATARASPASRRWRSSPPRPGSCTPTISSRYGLPGVTSSSSACAPAALPRPSTIRRRSTSSPRSPASAGVRGPVLSVRSWPHRRCRFLSLLASPTRRSTDASDAFHQAVGCAA